MNILFILLEMVGGLALFMYGMQMSSDGIQKSAGDNFQRIMNFMTGNRFLAVITGFIITVLVQSSSASTVMIVTFVNAGILDLIQAIGCIMGANIGTTVTGWIISLVGIKFSVKAFAVPIIGIGFFMSLMKKKKSVQGWGEALMGFGLIFLGLELLSNSMPKPSQNALDFLARFSNLGILTTLICVVVGAIFTALINASSAALAIIITLAMTGVLSFEMSAALLLGANIGTCTDAILVSFGTNIAAKRAAWAHVLFNVFGTIWAVVFFKFFISLVDMMVPGAPQQNIALHIAMMHTVFNTLNTIILLPFIKQYAAVVSWIIKAPKGTEDKPYHLSYVSMGLREIPELNIIQARGEISKMTKLSREMFERFRIALKDKPADLAVELEDFKKMENYADEMKEELSQFLVACSYEAVSEKTKANITVMIKTVDDLENITDICYHLMLLLERAETKKHVFEPKEIENLKPYTLLVDNSLEFIETHINEAATEEEVEKARQLEITIDEFKSDLKKIARKRLESGGDVRTELLYIDIVRNIEKVADYAFSVAVSLGQIR
jgi:phosphate:Na+ symporter